MGRRRRRASGAQAAASALAAVIALSLVEALWRWLLLACLFAALVGVPLWIYRARSLRAREALAEQQRLRQAANLATLLALDPAGFESLVATALRELGYLMVREVGRSGDRGVDILAIDQDGRTVAVQCKRYANSIGGPAIRNFAGARQQVGAQRAIFVTTAHFTNEAALAAGRLGIELWDGARLTRTLRWLADR